MDTYQWLIVALLVVIIAEVTYLLTHTKAAPKLRRSGTATLLDTSVLIDGRIVAIARAGFAGAALIVPRSVVAELQYLADMADHDKRTRARHGLDVVQELQQMKHIDLKILQDERPVDGVDSQLIRLAKRYNAQLSTIDYNLNKVAQVEGVTVLNINELAQALRISHLPGEQSTITLVQPGQGPHQAVGYLHDGTMVVVENAHRFIGKDVQVEFTRNLQTQAGRMMFARVVSGVEGYASTSTPVEKPKKAQETTQSRPQQPVKQQIKKKNPTKQRQQPAATQAAPVVPAAMPQTYHAVPQPQAKPQNQPRQRAEAATLQSRERTIAAQPRRRPARSAEDSLISLANKE